jgi:crotonobetainyl-CoA:carnitine CoA-transferase CaiB-like acyl-CoA transferase
MLPSDAKPAWGDVGPLRHALSGIRVVELAEGIAGGYCGKLFADLGAEVVKIERPSGDSLRQCPVGPAGPGGRYRGGAFLHLNTNKHSVLLDTNHDGQVQLERWIGGADVVIESTEAATPGQLSTWGLTWAAVHEQAPRVSVVSVTGFGTTGPYAGYRWDDIIAQAVSGTLLLQGRTDQDPLRLPGYLGLYFVGHVAALGALAAVARAGGTGLGSFVDCSAMEALASVPARQAPVLSLQYRGGIPPATDLVASTATLIPTGVFPCGDGYMAMMSTPQQLGEMLDVLDDEQVRAVFAHPDAFERPETKEVLDVVVYTWLLGRTRAEATAEAQDAGWPLAGINSPEEVLNANHLHQRGFWVHADDPAAGSLDLPGPWCRFAEGGWALRRLAPDVDQHDLDEPAARAESGSPPARPSRSTGSTGSAAPAAPAAPPPSPPLDGIRVVDLTTVWAGPYATMLLADLGAEVIRVENPWVLPPTTKGYHARPVLSNPGFLGSMYGPVAAGQPDRPWNRHAMNNSLARNKLSCTIDTRRPEGRELVMRLAEGSDVFIENFKTSGLAHIGISVSELQARNPKLIIVRMPPAGLTGDWSGYTGFGAQFDGLTGLLWLSGHRGADLTSSPATTYMDAASGPAAAWATLAALRYRAATGRGQVVEVAQSENIINHLGDILVDMQLGLAPERLGNRDRWKAPQGLYRCRGEQAWIAISVANDEAWRSLANAIGQPELGSDPRFADVPSRLAWHDELDKLIEAWSLERAPQEAFHVLQRAGVAAGPLLDDQAFVHDPQVVDRQWLQPLHSADVGTHLHPGLAFRGVPQVWRRGSPVLGEDNEYVYKELLGVSDSDFERYRKEQILADDYLAPDGTPY